MCQGVPFVWDSLTVPGKKFLAPQKALLISVVPVVCG